MPSKLSKLWATFDLTGSREISNAGALMLLALDDIRTCRNPDVGLLIALWRRYCASNLTGQEWQRAAFNRNDADANGKRALRELDEALVCVSELRILPTSHYLLEGLRDRFTAAMAVNLFVNYCQNTYTRLTGKFAD